VTVMKYLNYVLYHVFLVCHYLIASTPVRGVSHEYGWLPYDLSVYAPYF
jgi:hypothetical protein